MVEESIKNNESEAPSYVAQEKAPLVPLPLDKVSSSKPHPKVAEINDVEKSSGDSNDRVAALTRVETQKKFALITAWEESEKSKAENRAYKKLSAIGAWENTKKASVEAQLKQIEEEIEKEKAEYVEKMKNKLAKIHKLAEEKRAVVEAKRGEDILKAEEVGAKFRASGTTPNKNRVFGCFGC